MYCGIVNVLWDNSLLTSSVYSEIKTGNLLLLLTIIVTQYTILTITLPVSIRKVDHLSIGVFSSAISGP